MNFFGLSGLAYLAAGLPLRRVLYTPRLTTGIGVEPMYQAYQPTGTSLIRTCALE